MKARTGRKWASVLADGHVSHAARRNASQSSKTKAPSHAKMGPAIPACRNEIYGDSGHRPDDRLPQASVSLLRLARHFYILFDLMMRDLYSRHILPPESRRDTRIQADAPGHEDILNSPDKLSISG